MKVVPSQFISDHRFVYSHLIENSGEAPHRIPLNVTTRLEVAVAWWPKDNTLVPASISHRGLELPQLTFSFLTSHLLNRYPYFTSEVFGSKYGIPERCSDSPNLHNCGLIHVSHMVQNFLAKASTYFNYRSFCDFASTTKISLWLLWWR